jgi:predicted glycosyltransferase
MQNYYYVHTGHRIGLDRFRRSVVIINELQKRGIDITLLCSDFRIAHEARNFGVEKSVGIDVVRNIPQIAHHGDRLIFDSDEANPIMLEDMKEFFSTFDHIKADEIVVDDRYFEKFDKKIPLGFFFGDDDYEKDLEKLIPTLTELDPALLLGYYYFLDYEDVLKENFKNNYEFEDYDEFVTSCEVLITASPQAALECLASGGKPIFLKREDYFDSFDEVFKKLNIPIIGADEIERINVILKNVSNNKYQQIDKNSLIFLSFIDN